MSFLYSLSLKFLYPTSLCGIFLFASAILRSRGRKSHPLTSDLRPPTSDFASRLFFWLAVAVLLVCGNGWLVPALTKNLEWRYHLPDPAPQADAILVLAGGLLDRVPPRKTIEVADAGDRLLYAAHLFKQQKAGLIICTGGIATGGVAPRPGAEVMAEFLATLGVPKESVVTEGGSGNTHEHAQNLPAIFEKQKITRVLLVTSAMHMPRSMGVFQKQSPGIEFIPAPTDFRVTERIPVPRYRELVALVPTPSNLAQFSEVMHEYLGILYYRLRGWL